MLTPSSLLKRLSALVLLVVCQAQAYAQIAQPTTPEIDFTSTYAQQTLVLQATQLANQGNAVAIYQYAYNNFVFEPYHGSHSGSVNTFLGLHGSDVDIASSLIAMLRSQYIPARYAVGTVQLSAAQLTNWLGTGNANVAFQLLIDQGFQKLSYATTIGGSYTAVTETGTAPNIEYVVPSAAVTSVQFEHTWVEALIPYDQYRGLPTPTAVDCTQTTNASRCVWVPLDASYKQFTYNNYGLNPTTGTSPVSFNYTNYYDAIKNNDSTQLNLNPLTILENQITSWLQTNYAGHTLDDVANVGQIIPINDGLLPASLPYPVIGTVRTYESVAAHDAAVASPTTTADPETKPWAKYLTVTFNSTAYDVYANAYPYTITSTPILEATLNTDRLTLYTAVNSSITNVPLLNLNLGGSSLFSTSSAVFTIGGQNITVSASSPSNVGNYSSTGQTFSVTLNLTGAPDATGGSNDQTITTSYNNLNTSSYFAAVTGGAYSNWAQVHNAANQLLANQSAANTPNYPIVFNPSDPGTSNGACDFTTGLNCTPYVDVYGTGVYNTNDPTLLNDPAALDALTGGLLYVAGMQYCANVVDDINQVNQLMQTRTSITGFVGLVSSVYEAEYINNTAFSVMPGGLLIDIGTSFGGTYSNTTSPVSNASVSNSVYYLIGHIGSSLEHETWQELTGYDAVSTVRGIQMALSNTSTSLLTITSLSGLQGEYANFGFSTSVPSIFTAKTFKVCSSSPYTWNTACSGSSDTFNVWTSTTNPSAFDTFLSSVSSTTSALQQEVQTYHYDTTSQYAQDYTYYWANCTNNLVNSIAALPASTTFPTSAITATCDNLIALSGTQSAVLAAVYADWASNVVTFLNNVSTDQFNYFDESQGFSTSGRLYRSYPQAAGQYSAPTIGAIRTDFGIPPSGSTLSYTMPSTAVATPFNNFEVYIRTLTDTSSGVSYDLTFKINNLGQ